MGQEDGKSVPGAALEELPQLLPATTSISRIFSISLSVKCAKCCLLHFKNLVSSLAVDN